MASKNFSQFDLQTSLHSSDYIVGYKGDASAELRITTQTLLGVVSSAEFAGGISSLVDSVTGLDDRVTVIEGNTSNFTLASSLPIVFTDVANVLSGYDYNTNNALSPYSVVNYHGNFNTVLGGSGVAIFGGDQNSVIGAYGTNLFESTACFVAQGNMCGVHGINHVVVGGNFNYLTNQYNTVIASSNCSVDGVGNTVVGSAVVHLDGGCCQCSVVGGTNITAASSSNLWVCGGDSHTSINTFNSCIVGGSGNTIAEGVSGAMLLNTNFLTANDSNFTYTENLSVLNSLYASAIYLRSPNGTKFVLGVTNAGTLTATPA